jgi:hypothetical protein
MRKHFYGIAIFIAIVTSAVLIYGVLSAPEIPMVPAVEAVENVQADISPGKVLATKVITAEYDARTGRLVADIELAWKGDETGPNGLKYRVFLLEGPKDSRLIVARSDSTVTAFNQGQRPVRRVTFTAGDMEKIRDLDNIYLYVETASEGKVSAGKNENLANAVYVPVLRVHD